MGSLRHVPIIGEKQPLGILNPLNGKVNVLRIELYPYIFPTLLFNTTPTVPDPKNGSSTQSSGREPARTQGSTSFGGKVAKCAPKKGSVGMDQTVRRFLPLDSRTFSEA